MDSHFYAPGCCSGYPGAPKASLFAAPTEDELRKKWESNLRRADKPLTESSAVCERHFEPRYILRDYVHIINWHRSCEFHVGSRRWRLARCLAFCPNVRPTFLSHLSKRGRKGRGQSQQVHRR
ncbi:hypothetical protein HPB49_021340 [Dermacentor silvarum]|uniref:Uncharacterized protein n=1 Tax=Dermacentor silvarum TaxID=543639 RepID=A0ACB8CBB0_DERSI|nr:hypothetical protein HPB49_021340 [Dermacentor silvarum]